MEFELTPYFLFLLINWSLGRREIQQLTMLSPLLCLPYFLKEDYLSIYHSQVMGVTASLFPWMMDSGGAQNRYDRAAGMAGGLPLFPYLMDHVIPAHQSE